MKKILVIDDSPLYRDFISARLSSFGLQVETAANGLDGSLRMRQGRWDLVIMDYFLSRTSCTDILEARNRDPNIKDLPVIIASGKINRDALLQLSHLGIRKFFTKPLRLDSFVATVGEILGLRLQVDNTPSIMEAHVNEDMVLVEVARGLNPDKIELLRYRLQELMTLHALEHAKVLLIMTGLELSGNDSLSFSRLIAAITETTGVKPRNMKILSTNPMVRSFLESRAGLQGITMHQSLDEAMDSFPEKASDVPRDARSVLAADSGLAGDSPGLTTHFDLEIRQETEAYYTMDLLAPGTRVAIVDDDPVIRAVIKKSFQGSGVELLPFEDGRAFLSGQPGSFDLVFLDLMMPLVDGFQVLDSMRRDGIDIPVIILSALGRKDTILKALKYGVKSYVTKPVRPEDIQKKALEILRMNF